MSTLDSDLNLKPELVEREADGAFVACLYRTMHSSGSHVTMSAPEYTERVHEAP
jgi:hypothetical protein